MAREPKFARKCDGLSGFVYDCSDGKQSDMINILTKEIAEYVGREYPFGGDIRGTIQNLLLYKEEEPKECADMTSGVKKRMWERRVDEFVKREDKLKENCQAAYSLVMGQCKEYMKEKLAATIG
jgi:menaquinone-dependent protoporphyrinogen IX oxidase